jgi:hypothetical protein
MDFNLHFNKDWTSVAVSTSGGADSALLAYLVCQQAQECNATVHIISHIRCWKNKPWQKENADTIYNWLCQHFTKVKFVRHINFIAPELEYGNIGPNLVDEYGKHVSGDNIQQRSYAEYICHTYNIDAYYNGVTRNPRDSSVSGMVERNIEPDNNNRHLELMQHMGRWAVHPFRFVDKAVIVKTYHKLHLMELFNLTRSCEGEVAGIDYKTYKSGQYVPVCHTCFWCKERAWALKVNGLVQETLV